MFPFESIAKNIQKFFAGVYLLYTAIPKKARFIVIILLLYLIVEHKEDIKSLGNFAVKSFIGGSKGVISKVFDVTSDDTSLRVKHHSV